MGCCSLLVLATLFFQLQHILTIPISMEDATCSDKEAVIETLHRIADSVLLDYKSMAPSWSPAFFQKHLAIVSSPHSSTTERKMYSRGLATENDTSWKQDTGVVLYDAHLKTFLEKFTSDDDLMKNLFNGFYRLIGSSSYYNGSSELRRSIAESEVELHCSGDEPSPQTAGLCTGAVKNLFQLSEIVRDKLETYPGQLRHAVHHSEPMFMNDLPSEERLNAATVVAQKHTTDSEAAIQKAIVEMMDLYDDEKENFLENFPEHRHAGRILFDHSFKLINSHRFHKEKKPRQKRLLRRTVNNLCPSFTDNQADL